MIDLTVSKNFTEFLPVVRDNLTKVDSRFVKIIQKQEVNPLLQYFVDPETATSEQTINH